MTRRIILVDIGRSLALDGVLPSVLLYDDYAAALKARAGQPPYAYTIVAGALPTGLYLDRATGQITGTTSAAGFFFFTVRATDLGGAYVDRPFAITVTAEPLTLVGNAPDGTIGTAYAYSYAPAGGVPPRTYSIAAGALPDGVALNTSTGALAGTPTAGGNFTWTVRVEDSLGATFDLADAAAVAYAALTLSVSFDDATVGVAYSSDLTISGGDGTYSNPRATAGSVPSWATLSIVGDKLRLSGMPTGSSTTINVTVAVDSADGQTATSAQSVVVTAPSWYGPLFAVAGTVGMAFDFDNLSSMFQDTSHTIPATAAGQKVKSVQCQETGAWLVSGSGVGADLMFDATRNKYYLQNIGAAKFTCATPAALTGHIPISMIAVGTVSNVSNQYLLCVGSPATGKFFELGHTDSGSYALRTYGGGGASEAVKQGGFGVFTGTYTVSPTNRLDIYRDATVLPSSHSTANVTITGAVVAVGAEVGGAFPSNNTSGPYYGAVVINRVITGTELSAIYALWP